jgi:hypothetical protein
VKSAEIVNTGHESRIGAETLRSIFLGGQSLGMNIKLSRTYTGSKDLLVLYGAGAPDRDQLMRKHLDSGRHVLCWDVGYVGRGKDTNRHYFRVSVDRTHPNLMMDVTPNSPERWAAHGIKLRNDYDPKGPIIVAGMGPKSRVHLGVNDWEIKALHAAKKRFPGKRVLYRPKPRKLRDDRIQWEKDGETPISALLKGASLVICRHSNVAVDACIAGIPVECEDGAAHWLYRHSPTPSPEQRLDFLNRLAWWQWKTTEMKEAWKFLQTVCV